MMGFKDWFKIDEGEQEEETYEVEVICLNCRNTGVVRVRKGIDVKSGLEDIRCSVCGLKHFGPYFFNREIHSEEGYTEVYDPIECVTSLQVPDRTTKFYDIKKDTNSNERRTKKQ